jgi:methylglutaconyl-CoA hydratase
MTLTTLNTLKIERRGEAAQCVAWVWMAKPAVHNAFDETLITELTATLLALDADPAVRVIVLAGEGKSFSAGADLAWMQRQGAASVDSVRNSAARRRASARFSSTLAAP